MRCIVVGMGNQGHKRKKSLGADFVYGVDPRGVDAAYDTVDIVPLNTYDAAMVCVPQDQKEGVVHYLLSNRKHVLVEKPFDGSMVVEPSAVCYVAYNHRFEPNIVRMKQLIDSRELGEIYSCRMFYGNGTAQAVKGSWRDDLVDGAQIEIGSHLTDLTEYFFGKYQKLLVHQENFENKRPDYCVFRTALRPFILCEATYLSWKNTFTIDLFAHNGSAHIDGLTKWGKSTFTHRTRQFPPRPPQEKITTIMQDDETWELEYVHFKKLCEDKDDRIRRTNSHGRDNASGGAHQGLRNHGIGLGKK